MKKITIAASCLNEGGLIRDFVNLVGNKLKKNLRKNMNMRFC